MPRPARSLETLGAAFSIADARAADVPRTSLRRVDLRTPFHGVRATLEAADPTPFTAQVREFAPRLKPWQFLSHETALGWVGVPLPEWPYAPRLHVATHRPAREPRTAGVVGHRLQLRDSAVATVDEVATEHPVRAWRQCGTIWRLDDLIVAAEHLVSGDHPLATSDDLRREVEVMGDVRRGILRRALEARSGSRSPREVRLRLLLTRAGLPEPAITFDVSDDRGRFVAEFDLAYPRWHVAVEYDGRVHADDPAQFERDADRWERIRRAGWLHVRILRHHMAGSGLGAVERVRYALREAGWRPGR